MNTHYALLVWEGDFDGDHPDPSRNGTAPDVSLLACGGEDFCWEACEEWTEKQPLLRGESIEVVVRTKGKK